jgi:hypothetical protein
MTWDAVGYQGRGWEASEDNTHPGGTENTENNQGLGKSRKANLATDHR